MLMRCPYQSLSPQSRMSLEVLSARCGPALGETDEIEAGEMLPDHTLGSQ